MMIFLPDESKHTILPRGMARVHFNTNREPLRLGELGLRSIYMNAEYYKMVCDRLMAGIVPEDIYARIMDGPATFCGNGCCAKPIFTECYFLLLKK